MREIRRKDLIDSIEYSASVVSAEMGSETVRGILKMYDAESIEELSTRECEDVLSTLLLYESDCKD